VFCLLGENHESPWWLSFTLKLYACSAISSQVIQCAQSSGFTGDAKVNIVFLSSPRPVKSSHAFKVPNSLALALPVEPACCVHHLFWSEYKSILAQVFARRSASCKYGIAKTAALIRWFLVSISVASIAKATSAPTAIIFMSCFEQALLIT